MKPRTPRWFTLIPATHPADGRPVVIIDFGKLGQITLDGDDLEGLVAALEAKLREASAMGRT